MIYLTTNNICWHERMQKTVGPTTDQINWYCPDCGASRVTFPTADERSAAISSAINKAKATAPQPVAAEVAKDAARYRFLRMDAGIRNERPFIAISSAGGVSQWTGIHADKQIDAAMAGTGSDESKKGDGNV